MELNTERSESFKKRQRRVLILATALLLIYSAWVRFKNENPPPPVRGPQVIESDSAAGKPVAQ